MTMRLSLQLDGTTLLDSMESGDISVDCLSQKCLFHCRGENKIGQQNPVGWRSDKAVRSTASAVAVNKGEK